MSQVHTWRELLGKAIESRGERQRIAMELGVNPITLTRWVKGESNPRPHHLQRLPALLPRYRTDLLDLIAAELPASSFPSRSQLQEPTLPAIPAEFYSRVLHTLAITPSALLFRSLCDLILQQVLEHLDPQRMGLAAIIASCLPPSQGTQVHSLREHVGRGTPPWEGQLEARAILLGSESLAGYAVTTGHVVVNPQLGEQGGQFAGYRGEWEGSAAAAPIMRKGYFAGSFLLSSTQRDYFHSDHLALVEQYAELLGLAFDQDDYYAPESIHLWLLPQAPVQRAALSGFRERVVAAMIQATQQQYPLTLAEAELIVWQQFETEFFSLPVGKRQRIDQLRKEDES
jgi:transcriptional regulator with XRE-family HTH domain